MVEESGGYYNSSSEYKERQTGIICPHPFEYEKWSEGSAQEAYKALFMTFRIIKARTMLTNEECFNTVVRFLAHWSGLLDESQDPMNTADHDLIPSCGYFLWFFRWHLSMAPTDYLGFLYKAISLRHDETPLHSNLLRFLLPNPLDFHHDNLERIKIEETTKWRPKEIVYANVGTGSLLLSDISRYRDHPVTYKAIEPNLGLYRACLVNLRMMDLRNLKCFIFCGAPERISLSSDRNLSLANRWNPPDWHYLDLEESDALSKYTQGL